MTYQHWLYLFAGLEGCAFLITTIVLFSTGHIIGGSVAMFGFVCGQVILAVIRPPETEAILGGLVRT